MSLSTVFVQNEELEQLTEEYGLYTATSVKAGRFLCNKLDIEEGDPVAAEMASIFGPDYLSADVCTGCCCPLQGESVACRECPQAYCSVDCQECDSYHVVLCRGRSKAALRLHKAIQRMEEYSDSEDSAVFGIQLVIYACLEGLIAKADSENIPFAEYHPHVYHDKLFARPESDLEQNYKTLLADVFFCFMDCCFGPEGLFDRMMAPKWLSFTGFARMCSAVQCNSFELVLGNLDDSNAPGGVAMFPLHSLVNHSCNPNCTWITTIAPSEPPLIALVPLCPIPSGDALTICYVRCSQLEACGNVVVRRAYIAARRRFICFCDVCIAEVVELQPKLQSSSEFEVPTCLSSLSRAFLIAGLDVFQIALDQPLLEGKDLEGLDEMALSNKLVDASKAYICKC